MCILRLLIENITGTYNMDQHVRNFMHSITIVVHMLPFNYLENHRDLWGKNALGITCVFHFSLQLRFEIFFLPINIQ
jgi:hypothetical protein